MKHPIPDIRPDPFHVKQTLTININQSVIGLNEPPALFSDTEFAEDRIQDILNIDPAQQTSQ